MEYDKCVKRGSPKKFSDEELKSILSNNPLKNQTEIAKFIGVTQQTISHRVKKLNIVRKNGKWIV